jgi:hypothetical protein
MKLQSSQPPVSWLWKINTRVLETSKFRHILEGNHRIIQGLRLCWQQQQHRWFCQPNQPWLSLQVQHNSLLQSRAHANLLDQHTKKEPYLSDFCDPVDVESKCLKYPSDARDIPLGQESQLTFLLNNLKLKDVQTAFIALITIVGGAANTAFIPMPSKKVKDPKSMMINTDETSYW